MKLLVQFVFEVLCVGLFAALCTGQVETPQAAAVAAKEKTSTAPQVRPLIRVLPHHDTAASLFVRACVCEASVNVLPLPPSLRKNAVASE